MLRSALSEGSQLLAHNGFLDVGVSWHFERCKLDDSFAFTIIWSIIDLSGSWDAVLRMVCVLDVDVCPCFPCSTQACEHPPAQRQYRTL